MKKAVMILIIGIFLMALVNAGQFTYLKAYYDSLSISCTSDSDCVVQNVGNCCGYYPQCINKNDVLTPSEVIDICAAQKNGSCAPTTIAYCRCQKKSSGSGKKCVGFAGNPVDKCGDGNCFLNESDIKNPDYCAADCGTAGQTTNQTQIENITKINDTKNEKNCPQISPKNCPAGATTESLGSDSNGCGLGAKCVFLLSNGKNSDVKIMPETASQKAIDKLGDLGFNVILKQVGIGEDQKAVYSVTAEKEGKFLGLFTTKYTVEADVDSETGDLTVLKDKPWLVF